LGATGVYTVEVSAVDSDRNVTTKTRVVVVGDDIAWDDKYILQAIDYTKSVMDIRGGNDEILALTEARAWTIDGGPARVMVVENDGYGRVGKKYKVEIGVNEADAKLVKKAAADITAKMFTVVYDRNGADRYTGPSFVQITQPITTVGALPEIPTRSGYTFNGWNTVSSGGGYSFNANTTITDSVTVYAQWIAKSYTLSFNANGGDSRIPNAQSILFGQLAQAVLSPGDADQTFLGWNTRADGLGIQWEFGRTTMPARDIILYAQWTEPEAAPTPIVIPPAPTPPPTIIQNFINNITEALTPEPEPIPAEILEPSETPTTTFTPNIAPQASTGSWALLNLLLILLGIASALSAVVSLTARKDESETVREKRRIGFIAAILLAAANAALYMVTQSPFSDPMVWADEYTIASALIAIASFVAARFSFSKRNYRTEEPE
jgi:uncharacterized repeat protein (TIGR02543 family)